MITLTTEQAQQIEEALSELMDLMDGVREGDYKPDSFTNQPAEEALAAIRAARAQEKSEDCPCCGSEGTGVLKMFCSECLSDFWPPYMPTLSVQKT